MWQYRNYKLIAFLLSFGIGTVMGAFLGQWWEGLLLVGFVRTFYVQHTTFLINSWGHLWGYQDSQSKNQSAKNDHILAFMSLGEGYHNNHHNNPQIYTTQMKPREFDCTKYFILLCEKLGLASKLKVKQNEK